MGAALVQKLLTTLKSMKWPETPIATAHGFQTYQVGLAKAIAFKGNPKALAAALRTFQTGDSRPYAFAGIAYVFVQASREKDGSYDPVGLEAAMAWLEKAQEMEPDKIAINMIEALIYTNNGRFDDARLVLDYLTQQEPENQYLLLAEIVYWQRRGEVNEAVKWFHKAMENAVTVPERLQLRHRLGDYFMEIGNLDKALEVFQEAV
ncbi:MAG: tetratricopeptide repeat protein, partial [Anaerolineae bacterium]